MNLRFVEAFYWAVSLKSVTRAAEKLFVTQSALSSRIAVLEEELGVMLLDRSGRQLRLTAAGNRFLKSATRLLAMEREIKAEMGSGVTRATTLRIGAIESVLHSWLIGWVQQTRRQYPALALELTVETTPVLIEQMRRGTLDLTFTALPASGDGVQVRTISPMPMAFVGNTAIHRAASYSMAELAQFDLLTFQRGSQPHVALLDLFRQEQLDVRRVHTISSISAMLRLVEGGFGIATLPVDAVAGIGQRMPIRVLSNAPRLPELPIHISVREDPTDPTVASLVESAQLYADASDLASKKVLD